MMKADGFLIVVDGISSRDQLASILRERLLGARKAGRTSLFFRGHLIDVAKNAFAKPDSPEWIDWAWRLEITPEDEKTPLKDQIEFARQVLMVLREWGLRALVCANFEADVE